MQAARAFEWARQADPTRLEVRVAGTVATGVPSSPLLATRGAVVASACITRACWAVVPH